nr:hypothetical protein [Prevotella sp.]
MEVFEIGIIIIILCVQVYVAYLAWGQIESISHFLSSEDNLVLKQKSIEIEDDNKNETEYVYFSDPKYLGKIEDDAHGSFEFFHFSPSGEIKVGDKLSVVKGISKVDATIIEILNDGSYVDYASFGGKIEIRLDCDVEMGSLLFKIAEVVEPVRATVDVSLIYLHKDEKSSLLRDVIKTINNYLKKNKGGAADFHLIKDIVERHTDSIDEEINHKLPVPIYLGLMGTVLGIIIGLYSLSFEYNPATKALDGELFVNSVDGLITGVKQAMICSFVGLGLTTLLSSWRYMGAKSKLEAQKNAFYDFIQTRLLPQMTKDAASTILALQSNLEKFNTSFEENIKGFGGIMDEIHTAFDSQVALQKELKKMDLTQVANLNANVLVQLRNSMTEFEKFTQYLGQMNSFVRSTAKLTDSINDQLQRTEAVETITNAMQDNIQKNQLVMEKLRVFLERVNEQEAVVTAAGEIDSTMAQAIEELKTHAQEQINSIRTYTTEATEDLHDLVTSERGHLRKLDNLGKLDELDKLVSAIISMKEDNRTMNSALENKIETLVHAVIDNTKAQRGESGLPSWLKIGCLILFVVTCFYVIKSSVRYMSQPQLQDNGQMQMYNNADAIDSTAVDTTAADSVFY